MTQRHDGGPAYPHDVFVKTPDGIPHLAEREFGMTLRDAAALAAIQGLCVGYWSQGGLDAEDIATTANHIADAFLASLEGDKPDE